METQINVWILYWSCLSPSPFKFPFNIAKFESCWFHNVINMKSLANLSNMKLAKLSTYHIFIKIVHFVFRIWCHGCYWKNLCGLGLHLFGLSLLTVFLLTILGFPILWTVLSRRYWPNTLKNRHKVTKLLSYCELW